MSIQEAIRVGAYGMKFNTHHGADGRFTSSDGELDAAGMPTQQALDAATLERFGSTFNETYKTTIGGKPFFVKCARFVDDIRNEAVAYQLGHALGMDDFLIPEHAMTYQGRPALVAPWIEGKQAAADPQAFEDAVGQLSAKDYTRMQLYEYLTADGDRHHGNYMLDAQGQVRILDMGFAFRARTYEFDESHLLQTRAAIEACDPESVSLDLHEVSRVLAQKDAILALVRQSGVRGGTEANRENADTERVQTRLHRCFRYLQQAVQKQNPYVDALYEY